MSDFNRLTTASDVIDALGGTKKMAELLGVGAAAVSNYRTKGFPASKYLHIDQLCTENGLNVADAVFGNIKRCAVAQGDAQVLRYKDDTDFMGFSPTGFEEAQTQALQRTDDTDKSGLDAWLEAGFEFISTPILQPAAPFISRMGAEMQQRLYILTDPVGEQLCLRPDLTIPSALRYLQERCVGEVRYCYQGPAFRYQQRDNSRSEEFTQIGLEIMGGTDEKTDDARVLRQLLIFIKNAGVDLSKCEIITADSRHFTNMVDQYDFYKPIAARIKRQLNENVSPYSAKEILGKIIESIPSNNAVPAVATAQIVGRTGAEIANGIKRKEQFAKSDTEKLKQFITDLERQQVTFGNASVIIHNKKSDYQKNLQEIASKMGVDNNFTDSGYSTKVTYYTGVSFEIYMRDDPQITIARGGRYDDLLQSLGAKNPIPAVGGAIDLERLQQAAQISQNG